MLFDVNDPELTPDDVRAIRKAAFAQLKNGGLVLTEWTTESTTVRKVFGLNLKTLLTETMLYLKTKEPENYGRIVTRTTPNFLTYF